MMRGGKYHKGRGEEKCVCECVCMFGGQIFSGCVAAL